MIPKLKPLLLVEHLGEGRVHQWQGKGSSSDIFWLVELEKSTIRLHEDVVDHAEVVVWHVRRSELKPQLTVIAQQRRNELEAQQCIALAHLQERKHELRQEVDVAEYRRPVGETRHRPAQLTERLLVDERVAFVVIAYAWVRLSLQEARKRIKVLRELENRFPNHRAMFIGILAELLQYRKQPSDRQCFVQLRNERMISESAC